MQSTLLDWGKKFNNWFRGGNFNNRLIKTSFIRISGQKNKMSLYTLTKKGELEAKKITERHPFKH